LLSETHRHAAIIDELLHKSKASGNLVHDAHIAALCLEHGVSELLTADRDFTRFAGLTTSDPFMGH
jgi:predicted nucleic acid-binding protein